MVATAAIPGLFTAISSPSVDCRTRKNDRSGFIVSKSSVPYGRLEVGVPIMVATAAIPGLFTVISSPSVDCRARKNDRRGFIMSKSSVPYGRLEVRANAEFPCKINGSATIFPAAVEGENPGRENQLSTDKGALLAVRTEASRDVEDCKLSPSAGLHIDSFALGRIAQDGFVFRQSFTIRSYEIGADRKASLEALMNHLQEAGINHFKATGLVCEGCFGLTPEMVERNLIWAVIQIQVVVDRYPSWGDVIQVDTWLCPSGKNKVRRDWLVLDCKTGETLARASSSWVTMNKHTRKLCKIPEEVGVKMRPYLVDRTPILSGNGGKLSKLVDSTADEIRGGLTAGWNDLDMNEHVNNVKYIGWILESTATQEMMKSRELSSINLEYRRECGRDSILQSLTTVSGATGGGPWNLSLSHVECQHLLRLEDGPEVLRARTVWRLKQTGNIE